ncbi:isochorismatase family protein [Mobilicoccus massiliensis]|uniref:isochorismatase family protein n=1 Tax=Mobilicoccus massiliensis TaxID=1522310 RepID=UPI000AD503AB|nr:isochorismatase family protein [Mobilicoccus massiliensis]
MTTTPDARDSALEATTTGASSHARGSAGRSLRLAAEDSVVVYVDLQERLMPVIHDDAAVRQRARLLGYGAQQTAVPIVGTEQNPDKLGPLVDHLPDLCRRILPKMSFGACDDGLPDLLDDVAPGRSQIVLAGCEAHVCLLQTALGIIESGREAWVVADACGSRDPRDAHAAFARLAQAGACVVSAEMAIFEWLRTCEHPNFRSMSRQIKEPRFPSIDS